MRKLLTMAMLAILLLLPKLIPAAERPPTPNLKKIPTPQLIQEIKDDFKIKGPEDCVIWVGKHVIPEERSNLEFQEACVVAGYKKVFFDYSVKSVEITNPKIKELISRPDSPVGYFFALSQLGSANLYMYTKTNYGELDAHKLALANLQIRNNFLDGLLLGYPIKSIKFMYQASEFSEKVPIWGPRNYPKWPKDMKKAFKQYEKNNQGMKRYYDDVSQATEWLTNNDEKSISQLKAEIKTLEKVTTKRMQLLMKKDEFKFEVKHLSE